MWHRVDRRKTVKFHCVECVFYVKAEHPFVYYLGEPGKNREEYIIEYICIKLFERLRFECDDDAQSVAFIYPDADFGCIMGIKK